MISPALVQRTDQSAKAVLCELARRPHKGDLFRVCYKDYEPIRFSRDEGRWSTSDLALLNTSPKKETAIGEMAYHTARRHGFMGKNDTHLVYHLKANLEHVVVIDDWDDLQRLDVRQETFGMCSFSERHREYVASQRVSRLIKELIQYGEKIDGFVVPSARWPGSNLLVIEATNGRVLVEQVGQGEPFPWPGFK